MSRLEELADILGLTEDETEDLLNEEDLDLDEVLF